MKLMKLAILGLLLSVMLAGLSMAQSSKPDLDMGYFIAYDFLGGGNGSIGTTAGVYVFVQNSGSAPSGDTTVEISGLTNMYEPLPSLEPGEYAWYWVTYACSSAHTVTVTIDNENIIDESDETNNDASSYLDCIAYY